VSTAGDVNGDGYSDFIVGAYEYENGQTGEGRALVYLGSPSGLASSPAWTAEGDQASALFGFSVATAGDVNGDGHSDVIIGACQYSYGQLLEGWAYVYLGSASGLASSPAWTAQSDQAFANFGNSVATAGDVNGDGYSDVIVGANEYDGGLTDEGRAYVYLGSASGLSPFPSWTSESNQAYAYFGNSVATAGDVNGDGYSDVIVGAYGYDNGQTDEGRTYAYLGSPSGLAYPPAWTAESDQQYTSFGQSVASAGDVNGDGYSDIIVGANGYDNGETDEGRAFLYYGNGGPGLSLRPQQRSTTDTRPIAHLGASDSPDSFRLAMLGRTPFGRAKVKLEWEVKPLRERLNGFGTQSAVHWTDSGVAGAAMSQRVSDLQELVPYLWRARLRYHPATSPFQQFSRWLTVPWGGRQEWALRTGDPSAAGSVPDGSGGTPLRIEKAAGVKLTLSWGVSCRVTDTDFGVYEGTIGNYYSHEARYCGTGGATTKTLTPLAGDTYYLIVPLNATREGSYGTNGAGTERPPAATACLPQGIGGCP